MKLHELKPAQGATSAPKAASDGASALVLERPPARDTRAPRRVPGGGKRPGFEGGQMPLTMRLPKRGFTNKFRKEYVAINVDRLEIFEDGMTVTPVELIEQGIIKKIDDGVKIMGNGELTKKLTVLASKFTATAKEKIEAVGGKAEVI